MIATINGKRLSIDSKWAERKTVEYLREELDLTGTKVGCGIGVCGSCTVLLEDRAVRSCRLLVRDISDKRLLTIEGMTGSAGELHPLQQAFLDAGAVQCGYCTPGMILTAHAFLLKNASPTREDIRRAIQGNLCRCTGYQQIVDAIEQAAVLYLPRINNQT